MNSSTITQILAKARQRPRDWTALRYRRRDHWLNINWGELYRLCETLAAALASCGVKPGDRVALMSETRYEWLVADFAIMGMGAVNVPIYQSQRAEEVAYILKDSKASCLLLEDYNQWLKWVQVKDQCPDVKVVALIDGHHELPEGPLTWDDLLEHGTEYLKDHPHFYEQAISRQTGADLASLVYTSGTTGEPKGVVLTHHQITSEVQSVLQNIPLTEKDTSLAFLPFAHVLGRIEGWCAVTAGFTVAFAENIDRLRNNLVEIKPTVLIAVPRIFEKLHMAIITQVQANPILHKLFAWALEIGKMVSRHKQNGQTVPMSLLAQHAMADRLVFQPLQKKLGGRLRFAVSGGAPLATEISEFFHAIGILILEGYGLTETTAAITANTPLHYRFGTVGRPLPGVDLKLAPDGEIMVKAGQVTPGYHGLPDATAEALKDGYFYTGDIGEIDADGFLRITDRKKDLIKTAGGKYVAPQKLENLLKMSPYISQVLIHGDQEKYIVAVLTLNAEKIVDYAKKNEISYQDYGMLCQHPQVKALVRGAVAEVNAQLSGFETIKNFAILPREFTIEAGEITPSLKVKRKFCSEKYRDLIASLY
ncbi:MAG: long-chain fatty acid--CoA ligase [Bdellovibrionales bacterium]